MSKIYPSTNPPSEDNLIEYVKVLEESGSTVLHLDVMDGCFVENTCLSIDTIKNLRENTNIDFDIHLMVKSPLKVIKKYVKFCPICVTVHIEAFDNVKQIIKCINFLKKKKIGAGLSIKPDTNIENIYSFLPILDQVLIMSVEPGKSGQLFLPTTFTRIEKVKNIINKNNLKVKIAVDGGINEENIDKLKNLGVDYFIIGSAIYNTDNKAEFIKKVEN